MRFAAIERRLCIAMLRKTVTPLIALLLMTLVWGPLPAAATMRDELGREIQVPDDPRRVVALSPSITEIVFALEQQGRLVGTTQFSNYPAAASLVPKVGSYVRLDLERIAALNPDLCIAIKDGNPKHIVVRLQALGIPVFVVDPHHLASVMQTIQSIGRLLKASARANALVAEMQSRVAHVDARVARIEHRPRVFLQIGVTPIVSVGRRTFLHELIIRAGGINVAAGPRAYPHFSREQVVALAPDVVVITTMSRSGAFNKARADWQRLTHIPAVRHNRIHMVDSDVFDRPSPRLVNALEILTQLLHPGLLKDGP